MQRLFIVNGYFATRIDVAQSKEYYVSMDRPHIGIRFARMVDVVCAVAAPTAIDTPDSIDITDAQLGSMSAALSFAIRNSLAGVFGDLAPVREMNSRKTTSAVDS